MPPRSRGAMRPRFCKIIRPEKTEGAGNAGRQTRPRPRVQMKKAHEHSHHGHTGTTRHSPRNGFTAYFALSPAIGLVVTVICASSRRLDASFGASEPHDFAVRVSTVRHTHCPRPPHPAP